MCFTFISLLAVAAIPYITSVYNRNIGTPFGSPLKIKCGKIMHGRPLGGFDGYPH